MWITAVQRKLRQSGNVSERRSHPNAASEARASGWPDSRTPVNRTDPSGKGDGDGPPVDPCSDAFYCSGDIGVSDGGFSAWHFSKRYNTPYCGVLDLDFGPGTYLYNICWKGLPGSGVCSGNDFLSHPGCPAPPPTPPSGGSQPPPVPVCTIQVFNRPIEATGPLNIPGFQHGFITFFDPSDDLNTGFFEGQDVGNLLKAIGPGTAPQPKDDPYTDHNDGWVTSTGVCSVFDSLAQDVANINAASITYYEGGPNSNSALHYMLNSTNSLNIFPGYNWYKMPWMIGYSTPLPNIP